MVSNVRMLLLLIMMEAIYQNVCIYVYGQYKYINIKFLRAIVMKMWSDL